ncbi:MAG TPA: hypothetical protein PK466_00065 [Thermotogota bacterium]|nr:hypothetical protein [Thermotogota bacterium]HPJ87486.1 hypothetical protein [Thermotogota bacterium]HPR94691.1 hypothetical protein [Thermotogota bacterium]
MNLKGILFLFLTVIVLFFTINTVRNNDHFLIRYRNNVTFEDSMSIRDTFYVLEDTDVYIESFNDSDKMKIEVMIENEKEVCYTNTTGKEETPYKLHLQKGTYTLKIDGEDGSGENFDIRICYFTDEVRFEDETGE